MNLMKRNAAFAALCLGLACAGCSPQDGTTEEAESHSEAILNQEKEHGNYLRVFAPSPLVGSLPIHNRFGQPFTVERRRKHPAKRASG